MKRGRPPKYDNDFHPDDCLRLGYDGKFAVQMARDWEVCIDTIHAWKQEHPDFSDSYKKAQSFRTAWWFDLAQENVVGTKERQLNHTLWSMVMRYDGQNTDERTVKLPGISKCKTAQAKFECLVAAFESGQVTCKEAKTISDVIKIEMDATQVAEMKIQLDEITEKLNA